MNVEIYFDGLCPESLLKGKHVPMRLNNDDIWESPETGLQIAVFPPFAAILPWRGSKTFNSSREVNIEPPNGLVMCRTLDEEGREFLPNEQQLIGSTDELQWYLLDLYESKEAFDKEKFDPNEQNIKEQRGKLDEIPKQVWANLLTLFQTLDLHCNGEVVENERLTAIIEQVYESGLIFSFNWMKWKQGWKNIQDKDFDFGSCSMIEISMYITAIFRCDRFDEGAIQRYINSGTVNKIIMSLQKFTHD